MTSAAFALANKTTTCASEYGQQMTPEETLQALAPHPSTETSCAFGFVATFFNKYVVFVYSSWVRFLFSIYPTILGVKMRNNKDNSED